MLVKESRGGYYGDRISVISTETDYVGLFLMLKNISTFMSARLKSEDKNSFMAEDPAETVSRRRIIGAK